MPLYINEQPLKSFNYAGGECHVQIDPNTLGQQANVYALLNSADDVMRLLLTVDAIRRISRDIVIDLTIPYFPYARQDRVCNAGEALSVKVMADLINGLHCHRVTIIDPHSDVTPALINHCDIMSAADIVTNHLRVEMIGNQLALVSPDAGAEKKTRQLAKQLAQTGYVAEAFFASKSRDTLTGDITATDIHGDVANKNLLIVDDICDGGRTFIELAKTLTEHGAKDIYLYVTHGIFSKGLDVLKPYFKHVYCYHTLFDLADHDFLTIFHKQQGES
tara:strand:+ start:633 stop:1460 length:828 start_codon:yes stop_codon:yes gene_type:complete